MASKLFVEILSNQLQGGFPKATYPEMAELIDSMRIIGMDVNLKRQVYSEKAEINVASQKFASGVKAKQTVTREIAADAFLTSAADLSRRFKNSNNRILHLYMPNLTQPSTGFILAQHCHKLGIPVFITGLNKLSRIKLTFQVDPEFDNIPLELQGHDELLEDYRKKASKKTLFTNIARAIINLPIMPKKLVKKTTLFLQEGKNPRELFSDAEMINMMIASEYIARYQTLVDQFFAHFYESEYSWSKLVNEFLFLLSGIPFKVLKDRLYKLVPAEKLEEFDKKEADDPPNVERMLYYLRAYLKVLQPEHEARRKFKNAFHGLFYLSRLQHDPELHHQLIFLESKEPVETEFLMDRKVFYKNFSQIFEQVGDKGEHEELPISLKEIIFEEMLKLFFLANFVEKRSGEDLNRKEIMAREVLQGFQLFCMFMIDAHKIKPTKNVKGLAKVYAQKHTIRWGEIPLLLRSVGQYVNPLESTLTLLLEKIEESAEVEQKVTLNKMSHQYLVGALNVAPKLRYRLVYPVEISRAEKSAMYSALHQLGIQMTENLRYKELSDPTAEIFKESINKIEVQAEFQKKGVDIETIWIYRAYQKFLEQSVLNVYRQITHGKVDALFQSYGNHLFYRLYSTLITRGQVYIDYHQFAAILIRCGNLKKEHLFKFGYDKEFVSPYKGVKDRFYIPKDLSIPPEHIQKQTIGSLTELIRETAKKFSELVQSLNSVLRKTKHEEEIWIIKQVFRLQKDGVYDLWSAPARKILDSSLYSERLWDMIRSIIEENTDYLEGVKNRIVVFIKPEFRFLENFKLSENIEIEDKGFEVVLECNATKRDDQYDAFSEKINFVLSSWRTNKIYPPTIRDLEKISRIIQLYQMRWIEFQQASSMYVSRELVSQTIYREKEGGEINLSPLGKLDDSWKMMIGTPLKDVSMFPYPQLLRNELQKENYMTVAEFSGKIQEFKDTVHEMVYYTDFLQDLENAFAEIPHIKSAPKEVKLLRKSLRQLKNMFAKNFDDIEEGDLKLLEQTSSDILKLLFVTQKEETKVPMRYRFVSRSLNKFNFSRKGDSVKELNMLIKSTAGQTVASDGEAIENVHKAFATRLASNIKFYNLLNSKTFFFFFPIYNHEKYMRLSLENLLYFKGINTNLYVDLSQSDSLFDALLGYLPPQKLIKLKEILEEKK